ncbi:hypothetical protein Kpol_483p23 [Vanderwaltozyma polyspora DSM 70294]|uniref:XPG-I domain-containing protein n=1 Tax=Vanderwaltozyma polyspora (strain ATCC 22028 / DSM 70294 / BCRC 21397 / CBS 2163 / NBRC 10782 / NRRL Y-8283 / UCD 57-17) TaxID=436907 RepID=A7TQ75_VANPO|nr:uncharacterized protein Kpol_483p23 [Vanderwaltozyma polyspora DSM 70294]EDO15604.1 hypothetical protein Kpol_483p23 [Vanderwaltozyma polyspora DSM 70294]
MGVPQIWDLLKPILVDSRVPFRKFVNDFNQEHGRSPKIAIDAYLWLFECGFISREDSISKYITHGTESKSLLNLIHRLKEFLSFNVGFILVFDGSMKPSFKKDSGRYDSTLLENDLYFNEMFKDIDYKDIWDKHNSFHSNVGKCIGQESGLQNSDFLDNLKSILKDFKISYIDACGEAEAQCSWLQVNGYVDFVLTNDSDSLFFGCTKLLRNYSKYTQDLGSSGNSPIKKPDSRESFVTIVDMEKIRLLMKVRTDPDSFLLFSVLLGGDYNQGVKGLGKAKAAKLSQLEEPDFATLFRNIFSDVHASKETCQKNYASFQTKIYSYCQKHSVSLFGRNYKELFDKGKLTGWPSILAVMCYIHPIIIPNFDDKPLTDVYINSANSEVYKDIDFERLSER